MVLTGDAGAGKTTVVNHFVRSLPANWSVALVNGAGADPTALLRQVCRLLPVALTAEPSTAKAWADALHRALLRAHRGGREALLVVDDAHALSTAMLELMRQLNNLETAEHKLLQIILVGRSGLLAALSDPAMEQLAQRVVAYHHMPSLSARDVEIYVQQRLSAAGEQADIQVKAGALRDLHRLSGGSPRALGLLLQHALCAAASDGSQALGSKEIKRSADQVLPLQRLRRQQFRRWTWAGVCVALVLAGVVLALKPWLDRIQPA